MKREVTIFTQSGNLEMFFRTERSPALTFEVLNHSMAPHCYFQPLPFGGFYLDLLPWLMAFGKRLAPPSESPRRASPGWQRLSPRVPGSFPPVTATPAGWHKGRHYPTRRRGAAEDTCSGNSVIKGSEDGNWTIVTK